MLKRENQSKIVSSGFILQPSSFNLLLIMSSLLIGPIADAVASHEAKTPIASILRTAGWAQMPAALSTAAQLSAGVESARFLDRIQGGVGEILSQYRNENGALTDRSGLARDLMALARDEGLAPIAAEKRGTLEDVGSEVRAKLIVETQISQAYGYANWKGAQNEDALDAYPAQRLIRIRAAKDPRDWASRWQEAGEKVGWEGACKTRWVALKNSPIWIALSRFGTPWPPFDFGSGMWVEDVDRAEAEDLGLIEPGQQVPPNEAQFTDHLQMGVKAMSQAQRMNLQALFGKQVEIDSDIIKWKGKASDYESERSSQRAVGGRVLRGSEEILGQLGRREAAADVPNPFAPGQDYESNPVELAAVASGRKPLYHEDLSGFDQASIDAAAGHIQRLFPQSMVVRSEAGHLVAYNPDLIGRLADPGQALWNQVKAHSDDGLWLGYGGNHHDPSQGPFVQVAIKDSTGREVGGFSTPEKTAELYAAARLRDWILAHGRGYEAMIIRKGRSV